MKKIKLEIKDEVNCKFIGLELADRKTLTRMFEYVKPGARYLPSVRLGRWNGKISYFSLGGTTYVNLLPDIVPLLVAAGYDIEIEDQRKQVFAFNFTKIAEDSFKDKLWPKGHNLEHKPITLRDYQVNIVNNLLANPQSMMVAATGSGKTIITAALSHSVQEYGRSIVIVPNQSLVIQTQLDYVNLGLDVGVYYGGKKDLGKKHTICTWQSLNQLVKNSKLPDTEITVGEFIEDVVCVIVDEAHGIQADALKNMLTNELAHIPIRWALTGTLPKDEINKKALEISIGPVTGELAASDLQDIGVLANCHINILQFQDKVEYKDYQAELKFLTTDKQRLQCLSKLILEKNKSGNTLVLVDRLEAGKILLDELTLLNEANTEKVEIVFLSGENNLKERKQEYDSITTDTNKIILATFGIAAVGINIVNLYNVVLLEPGKSFIRTIQSIGRGLRKGEHKDHVEIYDITSSCKFSKRHLTVRKQYYKDAKYQHDLTKVHYK